MTHSTTRRRFVAIATSSAGLTMLAACSPPAAPPATPAAAPPAAPPVAPPSPAMAPAPEVAASPAPTAAPAPAAGPGAPGRMVNETDATAVALGYVADASRVDASKRPTLVAGSACSNCALYQGAAGSANGACPLFAGQLVAAAGWCTAWARKT